MNANQLRKEYIRFFESKNHQHYPSGLLIPYDVTGKLDESLLFNGAGMIQFKPYFRGTVNPENRRMITSQKCLRTGDIESVGDNSHLTFFEMLGNFSFGDYFKLKSIHYAWELLTSKAWLGLCPSKLCVTVFKEDTEAREIWSKIWSEAGYHPDNKIFLLGEDTNYWPAGAFTSGPPGPCGPNSEIFYWSSDDIPPTDSYNKENYLADEEQGKWLEIWNLVFIEYEWQGNLKNPQKPSLGYQKTGMPSLPFQSIDTGMGLERAAAVLSGSHSVYDTDAFQPIFEAIQTLTSGFYRYKKDDTQDYAARIIADHIRSAVFCLTDGVHPSNSGRGYILRRLIRRAILKGDKFLNLKDNFLYELVPSVQKALGEHYKELYDKSEFIVTTLKNEETLFRKTLSSGSKLLHDLINNLGTDATLSGEETFKLYDTFGFPLEITQEICNDHGIDVDLETYETCLKQAQEISRSNTNMDTVYGGHTNSNDEISITKPSESTDFTGYTDHCSVSTIERIRNIHVSENNLTFEVCLNKSPFYAASGGQVGDKGTLSNQNITLEIIDTNKSNGLFWHVIKTNKDFSYQDLLGKEVHCTIDTTRRKQLEQNHTATHLLHEALRIVLGKHVNQAGSLVEDHFLRFDFTHHQALSPDEIRMVESIVNTKIQENLTITIHNDVPIDQAKSMGAMALFGEKYGTLVRVVEIEGFSTELCGGTHLSRTGSAGLFKITHECSAASGIRRIEALTGLPALAWFEKKLNILESSSVLLKTSPDSLESQISKLTKQVKDLKKKLEQGSLSSSNAIESVIPVGKYQLIIQELSDVPNSSAKLIADRLTEGKENIISILICKEEGKGTIIGKASQNIVKDGFHVGNYLRELAKLASGGGGGKPDFASAGIKDLSKIEHLKKQAPDIAQDMFPNIFQKAKV